MRITTKLTLAGVVPAVLMMVVIVILAVRDMHRLMDYMADEAVTMTQQVATSELDPSAHRALLREAGQQKFVDLAKVAIPGIMVITGVIVVISFFTMRKISRRLQLLMARLGGVLSNQQDLTQQVGLDGKDEFSRLACDFDQFITGYRELVIKLQETVDLLTGMGDAMRKSSGDNLNQADTLKSHAESAATAMNELSASTQEIAGNINNASHEVSAANEEGRRLGSEIEEETLQVGRLAESIADGAKQVKDLGSQVMEIFSILDVIQGIADQTNLLALNAAIEAARAGEQGRGFAVVADEVRSLATRTRQSTEEIQQMLEALRTGSERSVHTMDRSQQEATSVSSAISLLGGNLNDLFQRFDQINDMNIQVASAGEEQNAVINDLNHTATGVSEGASEVRVSAQSNEQLRQDMDEQIGKITQLIGAFRT